MSFGVEFLGRGRLDTNPPIGVQKPLLDFDCCGSSERDDDFEIAAQGFNRSVTAFLLNCRGIPR